MEMQHWNSFLRQYAMEQSHEQKSYVVEFDPFHFAVSHKYIILAKGEIQLDSAVLFNEKGLRPAFFFFISA